MLRARWVDALEAELVQRGEAFFQLGGANQSWGPRTGWRRTTGRAHC